MREDRGTVCGWLRETLRGVEGESGGGIAVAVEEKLRRKLKGVQKRLRGRLKGDWRDCAGIIVNDRHY